MRVIVTGSRNCSDARVVYERLGQLPVDVVLVHGGARGIDHQAATIAEERGWSVEEFRAEWKKYGKSAGPLRNQRMVDSGADLCLAFPATNSVGTWDCVARAKAAGIPVEVIRL